MTIAQSLTTAIQTLNQKRINSAELDAEVLLSYVLGKERSFLVAYPNNTLTISQQIRFSTLLKRRANEEPVAYLTGHKEFFGLDFVVNKHTLIPRPDSELAVERTLKLVSDTRPMIADIGTGSGCIAVVLKQRLPRANMYATDISKRALAVAKTNAKKHQTQITFKAGDLLLPLKSIKLDLIVANLPYLDPRWFKENSIKFEPSIALGAGELGVDIYRRFFQQIRQYQPQATTIIEIDPRQRRAIESLLQVIIPGALTKTYKDLAHRERVMVIANN